LGRSPTSFDIIQNASEPGNQAALVFFLFDALFLDGEDLRQLPLTERKELLRPLPARSLSVGNLTGAAIWLKAPR
jgi:bifunctional non-homologous end joining protein LigD